LESIRRAECQSPSNYSNYRAAIEGAALLECVLEDDDAETRAMDAKTLTSDLPYDDDPYDDPDDRDPTVNELLDRGEL